MKNERLIVWGAVAILVTLPIATFLISKADAITLVMNKDDYAPIKNTLVLIPTFTANAYKSNGFYDYYSGKCGKECLSVEISQSTSLEEQGSESAWRTLERVGYSGLSDYVVDYYLSYQPDFLKQYDTILVLHNEYVTRQLYDALAAHPHVIYLAPNANYALITVDHSTMTLVSGHDIDGKGNAFGWPNDNSNLEYEKTCKEWHFGIIHNGYQLNCNPELTIHNNFALLKQLREL